MHAYACMHAWPTSKLRSIAVVGSLLHQKTGSCGITIMVMDSELRSIAKTGSCGITIMVMGSELRSIAAQTRQ